LELVSFDNSNSIECPAAATRDSTYIGVIVVGCALAVILIIAIILWFRYVKRRKNIEPSKAVMENKLEGAESPDVPVDEEQFEPEPFQDPTELPGVGPRGSVSPSEKDAMSPRGSNAATFFSRTKSISATVLSQTKSNPEQFDEISPTTSPTPRELPANGPPK
jgi:hypothetical protein